MDTQKLITAVFLICVAVGAVAAVTFIVIDGTQETDKVDYSDCVENALRTDGFKVGDYYERTTTYPTGAVSVCKVSIRNMDDINNRFNLDIDTDGTVTHKPILPEDFMHYMSLDYLYNTLPIAGYEKVNTVYGPVKCLVYSGIVENVVTNYYVGSTNGICYLYTTASPDAPETVTSVALTDTSLFTEAPGVAPGPTDPSKPVQPDSNKSIRTELKAGDFVELQFVSVKGDYTDRYTIDSIADDGKLTVTNVREGKTNKIMMTQEDFLDMVCPVMGGAQFVKTQAIDTAWGKVTVSVYYREMPVEGGVIAQNMSVDANGVMFQFTESGKDIQVNGDTDDWYRNYSLKDTSLLVGYTKG